MLIKIVLVFSLFASVMSLRAHTCPYTCKLYCPYGQVEDDYGCPMCLCNIAPKPLMPSHMRHCPPMVHCPTLFCPYGYQTNFLGCPVCQCLPKMCGPEPACANQCPLGYQTDSSGCSSCQCRSAPPQAQSVGVACMPWVCRSYCASVSGGAPGLVSAPTNCVCDCLRAPRGHPIAF